MSATTFNISAEVRKALKGQKTKVQLATLFYIIAPEYLRTLKAAKGQKDLDELWRMFRLEDPRR